MTVNYNEHNYKKYIYKLDYKVLHETNLNYYIN